MVDYEVGFGTVKGDGVRGPILKRHSTVADKSRRGPSSFLEFERPWILGRATRALPLSEWLTPPRLSSAWARFSFSR